MSEITDRIDSAQILSELDELENLFLQCRSVFPTLTDKMLGHREFITAPYYLSRGYQAQVQLRDPITPEFIERNRRLGKWINENALIRLYGIMSHYGFINKGIDKSLAGWREVDFMRRMRYAFTKTKLNYRPQNPKNVRLREEVIGYFGLAGKHFPEDEIPTPIDTVVQPIFEFCRKYIRARHNGA